jgi:uncharacterized glyoxalase superfamily protein PhnB
MSRFDGVISGIAPYLYYEDAAGALELLASDFGFVEEVRYLDERGEVQEAEMVAGQTKIMIGGGRTAAAESGEGQLLVVFVDDVDAHYRQVVSSGLAPTEPEDMPYGARVYEVTDPGGYRWTFWQPQGRVSLPAGWTEMRPSNTRYVRSTHPLNPHPLLHGLASVRDRRFSALKRRTAAGSASWAGTRRRPRPASVWGLEVVGTSWLHRVGGQCAPRVIIWSPGVGGSGGSARRRPRAGGRR